MLISPKFDLKSVYFILRSVADSTSSSSSPNFPNCSSLRKTVSVYAFSVSAKGYLSELLRVSGPKESYYFFCSPLISSKFLAAVTNLSSYTATGPNRVAHFILKHLLPWYEFFPHFLFFLVFSFLSSGSLSIISIHEIEKPFLTHVLLSGPSFVLVLITPASQCCLSASFCFVFFFGVLAPFSLHPSRFLSWSLCFGSNFCLSQSILNGFNKPKPDSRTILAAIDLSKAFDCHASCSLPYTYFGWPPSLL